MSGDSLYSLTPAATDQIPAGLAEQIRQHEQPPVGVYLVQRDESDEPPRGYIVRFLNGVLAWAEGGRRIIVAGSGASALTQALERLTSSEPAEAAPPAAPHGSGSRPLSELRDTGLLWLINRTVFHPRGFALALHQDDSGVTGWSLVGDGSEAWSFPDDQDQAHFQDAQATLYAAALAALTDGPLRPSEDR